MTEAALRGTGAPINRSRSHRTPTTRQYVCVRIEPRLGEKLWFAPRRDGLGWGWTPVSWEGWVVVAVVIALALLPVLLGGEVPASTVWRLVCPLAAAALVFAACLLKGSSPGGRRQAAEFDRLTHP
jgi:hypothetical protein